MQSHYGLYIKEREGKSILENEHGFFTYKIQGEECYIEDIFIKKESRRKNIGTEMADEIYKIAKASGCKFLTGSCIPSTNGATESMKAMLAYGFQIHSCTTDRIVLFKEIQ